jgi:hypothetical protein
MLKEYLERFKPSKTPHQTASQRHISGFLNGVESVSLFPPHHVRDSVLGTLPSDAESIRNDWAAVGHDLWAGILAYPVEEQDAASDQEKSKTVQSQQAIARKRKR